MINFITNTLEVVKGTLQDYYQLKKYHYVTGEIHPAKSIYKVRAKHPYTKNFPDPIAVNVYRAPLPRLKARTDATDGFFTKPATRSEQLKLVNKNILYGCRLIVDPRFRKIGIANFLIREALKQQTIPLVETLMPIGYMVDCLQKHGFKVFYTPAPSYYKRFQYFLRSLGLTEDSWHCPWLVESRFKSLRGDDTRKMHHEIKQFIDHYRSKCDLPPGIERTTYLLTKLHYPEAYLLWRNPRTGLLT